MASEQDPIGAPAWEPVVVEHRIRAGYSIDVRVVVQSHADNYDGVELLSLTARRKWFGLRQEVRLAVRGSEWDVARFWDGVCEELPRERSWNPFDLLDWW